MKKLTLIILALSLCLSCHADSYEYSGQNFKDNVSALKTAIEADTANFSGVTFEYIDYHGEDINNCTYKITCDTALTTEQQTALSDLVSTYNVSGWAEIVVILNFEYYARAA